MIPQPAEPVDPTVLTRRDFVKAGGVLFVWLAKLPERSANAAEPEPPAAAEPVASWIEIRGQNDIVVRTGRSEIGTGMSAFYAQVVAEELNVRPEAITLVMGDTDKTPDGGYSAGFLSGAANLRKVSAYTYQALLKLASTQLDVPVAQLSGENGIISGAGKQVSFQDLLHGQRLDLKIPVTGMPARFASPGANSVAGLDWKGMDGLVVAGNPPMKPVSQYKVVGTSFPIPGIPGKVTGKTQWSCDVKLPGMLHARMLRPATLGATLISVPDIDKTRFPSAEIVRKESLLAVVSPDEWEAIRAAQAIAPGIKWSAWTGLPGSENLTKTLRNYQWDKPQSRGNADSVNAALRGATKTVAASFEQPYVKHAPIGPFMAVASVSPDGSATIWTHSAHSQALRARMAHLLGVAVEKVVVRWLDHAGQFGRTTFGGDGAEADAVILSQLTGKPVRVQWTLQDDLSWSTASPGWVSDVEAGLDAQGRLTAFKSAFYSPHMFDARPLGALLAGMAAGETKPGAFVATEWAYGKIENRLEEAYASANIGATSPWGGIRGLIMRTPGQRQQNFALESLINEAAAAAKADPIQFRLQHITDARLSTLLSATAEAAQWESRPSPLSHFRKGDSASLTGRGVCLMIRAGAYWTGIAEIVVTPASGVIQVKKFTIGADCGKVINPRQLDRCIKGGLVMGLGEALKEEVTFDTAKVTSSDWTSYRILTMQEMPEIKIVQISRDDQGFGGGGEAPNALAPAAVAAAFFDATGIPARRIPLTPKYVQGLLSSQA